MRSSSSEPVRPSRRPSVGPGLRLRPRREDAQLPPRGVPLRPRRKMTRRGRLTLALLLAIGFAGGFWSARGIAGLLADPSEHPLPDVGAGPPGLWARARAIFSSAPDPAPAAEPPAPPPPRPAPEAVLALLPPSARAGLSAPDAPSDALVRERLEPPFVEETLEVEYTIDPELTRAVAAVLRRGRVALGHVILLDPLDGRVLAYVSTDPDTFPPTRPYPMASLMKVVTAAAVLESAPEAAERPCRFRGNPYRLTAALLDPPARGNQSSFQRALAMSNNQCFAQLAVHELGASRVLAELEALGVLEAPGPGHAPGEVDPVDSPLALGLLGSGLAGSRITPLAAARLAAALADGELVTPRWIERVSDVDGGVLALPEPAARPALDPQVTRRLRRMLVATTRSGTARRGFHVKGRPLLEAIRVSGKTGSLSGPDPKGHYEWFIGVAPAEAPRVAVATLLVHRDKRWSSASQVSAEVLRAVFCPDGACTPTAYASASRPAATP